MQGGHFLAWLRRGMRGRLRLDALPAEGDSESSWRLSEMMIYLSEH